MEIKVREVSGSEEKSKQEIEQELLQKHEEQLEGNIGIDTSKLEVASAPKEEEVVKEEPPVSKGPLDELIERLKVEKPMVYEQYRKALRQRRPAWIYPDLTVRIG